MQSNISRVLEITNQRAAERLAKISEIRKWLESWTLSQGFELEPQALNDAATLTYRREALVGLMAKATPFGDRWNEVSKEIVEVECEIARIDSRLIV